MSKNNKGEKMQKLMVAIIVAVALWIGWKYAVPKEAKEPSKTITDYGDNLKRSEEKAQDAAAMANLAVVKSAVTNFRGAQNRYPDSLQEVVDKGYLRSIPGDYNYDMETGEVTLK